MNVQVINTYLSINDVRIHNIIISWNTVPTDSITIAAAVERIDPGDVRNGLTLQTRDILDVPHNDGRSSVAYDLISDTSSTIVGNYEVYVTLSGVSASEYIVLYDPSNAVTIYRETYLEDAAKSCRYSDNGQYVYLEFTVDTNRGGFRIIFHVMNY